MYRFGCDAYVIGFWWAVAMAKKECPDAVDGFKRLGKRVLFDFMFFADEEAAFNASVQLLLKRCTSTWDSQE